jgi:hypothetical protein
MALRGLQWTAEAGMFLEREHIEPVAELTEEIEERLTAVAEEMGGKIILPRAFPAGRGQRVKVEPTPTGLKIEILDAADPTSDSASAGPKTREDAAEPQSGRAEVDSAPDAVRGEAARM